MSQTVDVESGAIDNSNINNTDDPLNRDKDDKYYLQSLIERFLVYEPKKRADGISHLRREILWSDASKLDVEDDGGLSTFEEEFFSEEQKREYSKSMCLFERLLWVLLFIQYKDTQLTDVVEIFLVKSNLNYEVYKNGCVLSLLMKYDEKKECTVKYLQWQIFNRIAEKYMLQREKDRNSQISYMTANSVLSHKANSDEIEEATLFLTNIANAIRNKDHLDEIFEAVFASGSFGTLKYLLKEVTERNLKLQCPVLVNAVYWSIYVKDENQSYFNECFQYTLEVEKNNLQAKDSKYGDTALHIANDFQDQYMIRELLKRQPPIAVKNKMGQFPISNIQKDDLKNFLDSLITDIPTAFLTSLCTWKIIKGIYLDELQLKNVIYVDLKPFFSTNPVDNTNSVDKSKECHDLELIKEISDSKELWELVDHPVISTLLVLHWNQLKYEIMIDHFLCTFIALLIFFVMLTISQFVDGYGSKIINILIVIASFIVICLELLNNRKVFVNTFKKCKSKRNIKAYEVNPTDKSENTCEAPQVTINILPESSAEADEVNRTESSENTFEAPQESNNLLPQSTEEANTTETDETNNNNINSRVYGTIFSFCLTLPFITLICLFGFIGCFENVENCKEVYGLGIIVLCLNISLLIGYFSKTIAINLIMFFYVALTGVKFIGSTFLILLGFAFSLTTLIKDYGLPKDEEKTLSFEQSAEINKTTIDMENSSSNDTQSKHIYALGVFKTIVMSTGEFELGDLQFSCITSYLVFISFVFTIPIVFINLLNALAIEDVQKIKKEAMIWYRRVQIMFLYEYKILHKSFFRPKVIVEFISNPLKREKNLTKMYPDIIGEKAFIGIKTTTKEMFQIKDFYKYENIGVLPRDVVDNAVKELNYRKNVKNIF